MSRIARQAFSGSIASFAASAVTITLGVARSLLLLKLLRPDDFGVATQALFFVGLTALIRLPGMDRGIVHREEVSQSTLSSWFTLRMSTLGGSLLLMALLTPLIARFYPDMPLLGPVILAFLAINVVAGLSAVQEVIHSRDLHFKRIAWANALSAIAMTVITPYLAWRGWGVWSLVAERFIGQFTRMVVFWSSRHMWFPHLGWNKTEVRWLRDFGLKGMANANLSYALNRFDDFWVGTFLGKTALGYYSRAYELARYPRRLAANPLLTVFFPTFARLQTDREKLSKAFTRSSAIIIRFGLWVSLLFILLAPELVLFLGEEWYPMLRTLQLMVVYTMLDPVSLVASNLLVAMGYPEKLTRVRLVQAAFFIPAVILLGQWQGIEGVAVAANLMILLGIVILYRQIRPFVDFSAARLWVRPLLAMAVTGGIVWLAETYWGDTAVWAAVWVKIILKGSLITGTYSVLLLLLERKESADYWRFLKNMTQPYTNRLKYK